MEDRRRTVGMSSVPPLVFFSPTPVFILATPARLQLAATRCQCAAPGRTRDGRLYRSGPASLWFYAMPSPVLGAPVLVLADKYTKLSIFFWRWSILIKRIYLQMSALIALTHNFICWQDGRVGNLFLTRWKISSDYFSYTNIYGPFRTDPVLYG